MGESLKSIPFFSDDIRILVRETNDSRLIHLPVSIRSFSNGMGVRLEEVEGTEDLLATRADGNFMRGPQLLPAEEDKA